MPANAFESYLPAGHPRRKVRDFLRGNVLGRFTRECTLEWFGKDITDDLMANGLVEPARKTHYSRTDDSVDGEVIPGWYRVAEIGARFSSKLLIPPLPRDRADQIIADMLKRARAINRRPELLFYVSKITVFGSYLTDAKELGDIDVSVDLARRIADYKKFKPLVVARARALAPFRYFYLGSDEYSFVKNEVRKLLKNRNPYLSMMIDTMLVDALDTPKRVIFKRGKR